MIAWEETLAVRDSVFVQIAILTMLAMCLYTIFPRLHKWMRVIGVLLFVALFFVTVFNLWQPA
jgi:hypothetical protein